MKFQQSRFDRQWFLSRWPEGHRKDLETDLDMAADLEVEMNVSIPSGRGRVVSLVYKTEYAGGNDCIGQTPGWSPHSVTTISQSLGLESSCKKNVRWSQRDNAALIYLLNSFTRDERFDVCHQQYLDIFRRIENSLGHYEFGVVPYLREGTQRSYWMSTEKPYFMFSIVVKQVRMYVHRICLRCVLEPLSDFSM